MTAEPAWLTVEAVLAIHDGLIAAFGGAASLRDRGLLESALASPRNHHGYGEKDLFSLAAQYAVGLTRNHPFVDGNKRLAFMAAYTFLGINGRSLDASEPDVVAMMLGRADRSVSEKHFAEWLRASCTPPKRTSRASKPRPAKSRRRRGRGS